MTAADTDRSLQLVLEQGHGTPVWTAARQQGGSGRTRAITRSGSGWQPKKLYQAFIDDSHEKLRAEFELWKQRWHAAAEPPKTALDAYTACNASLYPNLSILLVTYPSRCSSLYPSPLPRQSVPFPLSNG